MPGSVAQATKSPHPSETIGGETQTRNANAEAPAIIPRPTQATTFKTSPFLLAFYGNREIPVDYTRAKLLKEVLPSVTPSSTTRVSTGKCFGSPTQSFADQSLFDRLPSTSPTS